MSHFDLTDLAIRSIYPNNRALVDDTGLPSVMVYIPKFKNSDVLTGGDDKTHPAFIVNGEEIPGFYYSKYQNVVHEGVAYSLPGEDPAADINYDDALECCEAKGHGWHLSTNAEWAAIALWCKRNGFLPIGRESQTVVFGENGAGSLAWSHDGTAAGIWDMNNSIGEIQSGLRLVCGELQILANNDAADPENSQSETSTLWRAINAADGTLVEPECKTTDTLETAKTEGKTVRLSKDSEDEDGRAIFSTKLDTNEPADGLGYNCYFYQVACDETIGSNAKRLLQSLALVPVPDSTDEYDGYGLSMFGYYVRAGETFLKRGVGYLSEINHSTGIFATYELRGRRLANSGLRAAYIPEI